MTDIEKCKMSKLSRIAKQFGGTTKYTGNNFANRIFVYAYSIKEEISQKIANQRNIDKLNR